MALEGDLSAFPFEDILRHVHERAQSGTLEIERPGELRRLMFDAGRLIYLQNLEHFSQIGPALLGAGIIDRQDYYHLLDESRGNSAEALRRLAVSRPAEMDERLPDVLRDAVDDELLRLATADDGAFRLFAQEDAELPSLLRLDLPVDTLAERSREIRAALAGLYEQHPELETGALAIADPLETPLADVSLAADEWTLLSAVNSRRTLDDLVRFTGLGRWRAIQALDRLLSLSLVHFAEPTPLPAVSEELPPDGRDTARSWWARNRGSDAQLAELSGAETLELFCNRLLARLAAGPAVDADPNWLLRLWTGTLSRYPLADLVCCTASAVQAGRFARASETFAAPEMQAAVEEETERALAELARGIEARLVQQVGLKKAEGLYTREYTGVVAHQDSILSAARRDEIGLPAPSKWGGLNGR